MEAIAFLLVAAGFFWLFVLPLIVIAKLSKIQNELEGQKGALRKILALRSGEQPTPSPHQAPFEFQKTVTTQTAPLTPQTPVPSPIPSPTPVSEFPSELSEIPSSLSDLSPSNASKPKPVFKQEGEFPERVELDILANTGEEKSERVSPPRLPKTWRPQGSVFHETGARPPHLPERKPDRPESAPPKQSSPLEKAAEEAMGKIGNWLLFGHEKLAPGVSFEFAVASTWLLRIGILILVLGLGFFVKYSIDNNLISEEVRVLVTAGAGFGLLIGGTRLLGGTYQAIGQGLMGGGLTTLYFSVFAAESFYHLITPQVAFFLMAMVTVLAGAIAVGFSTITVAVIGVLGGYGTPIFIQSQSANLPVLHTYMLILAIGILGICTWRKWPLVHFLAFVCHYSLFVVSIDKAGISCYENALPFAGGYFLLFSTMPFIYGLRNKQSSGLLDLIGLYANAGVSFLLGWIMLRNLQSAPAFVRENGAAGLSLGLAFFYAAHAIIYLRLKISDRPMMISFLGLSSAFLALTMPLYLDVAWLTSSWAIQAVVMVWISQKLGSSFLRQLAYVLMMEVLGRFVFVDLVNQANLPLPDQNMAIYLYLGQLLTRLVQYGIPVAGLFAAGWLLQKDEGNFRKLMDASNDIKEYVDRSWIVRLLVVSSVGLLFIFMLLEANQTLGFLWSPIRLPGLTWILVVLGFVILFAGNPWIGRDGLIGSLAVLAIILCIKLIFVDLEIGSAGPPEIWIPRNGWYPGLMGLRVLDFVAVICLFGIAGWFLTGMGFTAAWPAFGSMGVVLSLVLATAETHNFFHYLAMDGMREGAVSIVWTLFALGILLWGIRVHERYVRYCGLGLFVVVAIKVFASDLASQDPFYRIIASLILGVLLLLGSFVYLKYQSAIQKKEEPQS